MYNFRLLLSPSGFPHIRHIPENLILFSCIAEIWLHSLWNSFGSSESLLQRTMCHLPSHTCTDNKNFVCIVKIHLPVRRASLWQRHQKYISDVKNAHRLLCFAFLRVQRQQLGCCCCCFVALFRYYFFYELKLLQRCTVATSIEPCRCIYPLFCHFVPPLRLPSENATDMFLLFVTLCSTFALFGMTLRNKITSISYRLARCNAYNCTLCIETMWRLARLCFCACFRFSVLSFSSVFAQRWVELDFCYWHWFCISLDCIIMFFCWFHFAQCLVLVGSVRYHAHSIPYCYPPSTYIVIICIPWNVVCVSHGFDGGCGGGGGTENCITNRTEESRIGCAP